MIFACIMRIISASRDFGTTSLQVCGVVIYDITFECRLGFILRQLHFWPRLPSYVPANCAARAAEVVES